MNFCMQARMRFTKVELQTSRKMDASNVFKEYCHKHIPCFIITAMSLGLSQKSDL